MALNNKGTELKKRIFENINIVIDLENKLQSVFGEKSTINTLNALAVGSVIIDSQKNLLKQVRDDIDRFISDDN